MNKMSATQMWICDTSNVKKPYCIQYQATFSKCIFYINLMLVFHEKLCFVILSNGTFAAS